MRDEHPDLSSDRRNLLCTQTVQVRILRRTERQPSAKLPIQSLSCMHVRHGQQMHILEDRDAVSATVNAIRS
jgi:hypothetical protein